MIKQKIQTKNGGFTLIELMVATSIFMIIMLVAMGSLVTTSDAAKKAQSLNFTMDNLSFAMETMSRSLRMGTNYTCGDSVILNGSLAPQDCENKTFISFIPASKPSDYRMAYKQNTRGDETHSIQRCDTNSSCVDIISSNIDIQKLGFFVRGSTDDIIQPSIYMIVKGVVTIKNKETSFAIQTMVSQRTLE